MQTERPDLIEALREKLEELSLNLERMKLAEYVDLLNRPGRLLYINFISGLARGVGIVVGFAILGTVLLLVLKRLLMLHLPLVSSFIAQVIRLVELQLHTGA